MPSIRLLPILALAAIALPLGAQQAAPRAATSASANDSSAVAAIVGAYHHALATGDSAAALAMLAPDAVVLESGDVETRAGYRAHHLAADIEFERAVASRRSAIGVTVVGDAAWATSTTINQGTFRGRAIDSAGAELMVLSRGADGRWSIRAIHWSSHSRRPATK